MIENLFWNTIRVSVTTSAVIVLLLLLQPLIHRHYNAKWRYFVWLILAVRLLIPFSPSLPQTPVPIMQIPQQVEFKLPVQNNMDSPPKNDPTDVGKGEENTAISPSVSSPIPNKMSLGEKACTVWVLGMSFFLLYHLTGYFILKKSIVRFSKTVEEEHTAELWREVKKEMNRERNIPLLIYKKGQSPMITGFFRPVLLLPDVPYGDEELKLILKHELIHYKRKDIWYKLLLVCANAMHWFNPLVYLMRGVSNRDIEMVCDSELIKGSDSTFRKQYSEAILSAIHRENHCKTAFSTDFYGGKRTMKERLTNIFDRNKKRKGVLALCAVVLLTGISGASVAYGVDSGKEGKEIDNIALLDAGTSNDLQQGKWILSYGDGDSAIVPLEPDTDNPSAYLEDKAVYISDEVTAVAYSGGAGEKSPVSVLISRDKGQNWEKYDLPGIKAYDYPYKYIGFSTQKDGWMLLAGDVAMGRQQNRIFQTSDSGKTWTEIGNTNGVYERVVTGAGFVNENVGFVSFRYDMDTNPVVYRTENKGKTWTKCSLEIPGSFRDITSYATALAPVFKGAKGVLPVTFRNNDWKGDPVDVTVRYETSDYGKTWKFNEKYNLALIWGNAWVTRDGRARYEIMDSKMQEDFRSQQFSPDNFVIRWSSPWVERYDVALDGEQAVITYWYTDSTQATYKGVERLTFTEENSRGVIKDCRTEVDMEEYADISNWKSVDTGLYTFSVPDEWGVNVTSSDSVRFIYEANGQQVGTLSTLGYDPSRPFSQLEGNHAQTLSTEKLKDCKYPATKVIIRKTLPAAAKDDSYEDELHIYLIPQNSKLAYDLCFDASWGNAKAVEVAKSMEIQESPDKFYQLACLEQGRTWLSAAKLQEGMFSDMSLSANGKIKHFSWETYSNPTFLPELTYADVDGDGKSELLVILCKGEGTGFLEEEIHVLNPEDLSEIAVENPLTALSNRMVSKIDQNGVKIQVDKGEPLVFSEKDITAKVAERKSWFNKLETGNIVDYSVQGNAVMVSVEAQLSPVGYLGSFNLTYEYKNNKLKVKDIRFSSRL
ncbi:M56 family metallopeptidase [Aminipila luticellarii]|nr:M56 family metallopeptidase [Aminipila luticellarii]